MRDLTKEKWWDKYLKEWRLYPHLCESPLGGDIWVCEYCHYIGTLEQLNDIGCTEHKKPCKWCGQTPLCAPECIGMRMLLSDDKVYVAGDNPFEEKEG